VALTMSLEVSRRAHKNNSSSLDFLRLLGGEVLVKDGYERPIVQPDTEGMLYRNVS
jgi:hypothetical protein